ncbi:UDP-glucose 4-epimerase GalE [Carpediemonas membranifera]|uniref:UDP-glucose 4-epimerase n=1 Tax=Carpediemonas membranifera TaxID=201153 RepID=A0A8J6BEX9_9EUKA|nr:UDP-glucose 4-epimerase GalE [Carpediemonas membranifera]|eukprot:KAG9396042.1 UDP-glucose 4-epimerase GalE [Carpediemonas membranifera]
MGELVLVCGGAGYIGSICVHELIETGYDVVVFDNMTKGHKDAVDSRVKELVVGDVRNEEDLNAVLSKYSFDACMHFCADSLVGESVKVPLKYYDNNMNGAIELAKALTRHNVGRIVFSSTAAIFGEPNPEFVPIAENCPKEPTNPYGETKLSIEHMLRWTTNAHDLKATCLRYFNAAGALPNIGEDHSPESHLIPIVLQVALGKRDKLAIFGDDYPTRDGTCVRDYIHVVDLAHAHIKALEYMKDESPKFNTFNLGTSNGLTVKEIIETSRKVTGHPIPADVGPRRDGDPATLVADSRRAQEVLGWTVRFGDVESIIRSAWEWHQGHPDGYAQ